MNNYRNDAAKKVIELIMTHGHHPPDFFSALAKATQEDVVAPVLAMEKIRLTGRPATEKEAEDAAKAFVFGIEYGAILETYSRKNAEMLIATLSAYAEIKKQAVT